MGAGVTTITLNATTLSAPVPSISTSNTSKVYGSSDTTLNATQTTTYDSGVNVYYNFGNSTSSSGTYTYGTASTTATTTVSKTSHFGVKYYKVKAYATDGTLKSTTATWSSYMSVTLTNPAITLNANSCGTIGTGTNPFYAKYGTTNIYTTKTGSTAATFPTFTVNSGYTVSGWYTATSGGTKVLNADGSLTGTAVSGYTSASAWAATANKTLYAQCTANTYTIIYEKNQGDGTDSTCPNTVSGTMANTTATYGASNTLRANAYSCSSRVFVGWYAYREYVNASGSTVKQYNGVCDGTAGWKTTTQIASCTTWEKTIYADKAAVSKTSPSGTVKMYAQWEQYAVYDSSDTLSSYESSLQDAFDSAQTLGTGTIKPLLNTTESSNVILTNEEDDTTNITLNPSGYTINLGTNYVQISNNINLNISGSGTITGSNVTGDTRGVFRIWSGSTLNLSGPTISNTGSGSNTISVLVYGGDLNITSGSVNSNYTALGLFGGRITINNGTITGNTYGIFVSSTYAVGGTNLEINGGTIKTANATGSIGINVENNDSNDAQIQIDGSPVIYGYNNAIWQQDTGSTVTIKGGTFESNLSSTISNYGTINLGSGKGTDSSHTITVAAGDTNVHYAIANYANATINHNVGTYSYSNSSSGVIYNAGTFNLNGGRIYRTSTSAFYSASGTQNLYGSWTGKTGTYSYNGTYANISGMLYYSYMSSTASSHSINATSVSNKGSVNDKGFYMKLDLSVASSTSATSTLTVKPRIYAGYTTYTDNCYGKLTISCTGISAKTYYGKYNFSSGTTYYVNKSSPTSQCSSSSATSIITTSSSSALTLTRSISEGQTVSCTATFSTTKSTKVGKSFSVNASITAN